jgi:hypothetical protein
MNRRSGGFSDQGLMPRPATRQRRRPVGRFPPSGDLCRDIRERGTGVLKAHDQAFGDVRELTDAESECRSRRSGTHSVCALVGATLEAIASIVIASLDSHDFFLQPGRLPRAVAPCQPLNSVVEAANSARHGRVAPKTFAPCNREFSNSAQRSRKHIVI